MRWSLNSRPARALTLVALLFLGGTGAVGHAEDGSDVMGDRIIGMYIHQHWAYNHPYAARTWPLEDWRGYLDGLGRIGYNTIMIWPMLETMPDPLTPSDVENIEKIARVIDMAHREFDMKVFLTLSPNAVARNDEAARYTFQDRPFFYCDDRADPGDAVAMGKMIAWREKLLEPLKEMDGIVIIDSDPGGYPGSTNLEFVYLLQAHRRMLDRLRKGIEVIYWIHVGWEGYCRYYATAEFAMGTDEEVAETLRLLAEQNPEPWGVTGGRPKVVEAVGLGPRMFPFPYGAIEGEPSFPMTNFGGDTAYNTGRSAEFRGIMGNSQTHCVQLPNAFAFARGALGLPIGEAEYLQFAEDLVPGHGGAIVGAWKALAGEDEVAMRAAIEEIGTLLHDEPAAGPLQGLLFGSPKRFLTDLVHQLRLRAALERLRAAVFAEPADRAAVAEALGAFADAANAWQQTHGYKNQWYWPRMDETLQKINHPGINEAMASRDYTAEGDTPMEKLKNGFARVETYTPRLIEAMKKAAAGMR